ncbi:MAG: cell surface protein SprA [Bacteroidia bacterium]
MTKALSKYLFVGGLSAGLLTLIVGSDAKVSSYNHAERTYADETAVVADTPEVTLPYGFDDESTGDPLNYPNSGGLKLNEPSNVKTNVEYDPSTGFYNINQSMGGMNYRPPTYMESDEYQDYMFKKQVKKYWNARSDAESQNNQNKPTIPKLNVGGEIFDRIFGGNTVDIRPNGSAELIFAYNGTKTENPAIPVRNRKVNTFDFNERIQLNVIGKIGTKLNLTTSYNTEAMFDFENQMKLAYAGEEDDIIKKIEAGNVSLPLNGSLITGSQTLFGVKTQLQFGRLTVTGLLSQQKGKKSEVEVAGGAQVTKYEIEADNYEANKHFFLAQYFRDQYNTALANLPFVNSGVNINRIEVWISNTNTSTNDIRSVVAFSELAEDIGHIPATQQAYISDMHPSTLPYNGQNDLYGNIVNNTGVRTVNTTVSTINSLSNNVLKQTINFELVASARKLQASEYTFNARLGYISLNQQLNPDQVLSVAYQYTLNGQVYQVGEFSDGGISAPQALYTKMLKSTAVNTAHPMWHLMMKNIYSIGSYQINAQDFKLNIFYNNLQTGTYINYLPVPVTETQISGKPLIQVLNVDRINQQNDQLADGLFDFIDGVTINANNGRIIFPVVEPFGDYLREKFNPPGTIANTYVFDQLYDSTRIVAQQFPQLNRFKLRGQYQSSSSSEISLGSPNVPQGSVTVTAGGIQLTENVDYTVDYTLGRVKIINDGILNSGTPIKIALESNALFAIQQKTLLATHLDYKINNDFNVGATVMNLTERPVTQKVNIGDEAISNTIWGLDGTYRTEAPFLTRWIDKIPFLETKEMSTINAAAEYAYLIPGHNKAIGKDGNSYIDDFEGSQSTIDLRSQSSWTLASTPQGQAGPGTTNLFPEGDLADTLAYGFNRAKLAWYVLDPMFIRQTTGLTPGNISDDDMSNNLVREVPETEVFPNRPIPTGVPSNVAMFDLAYYPEERGPYNYDTDPLPGISAGLAADGKLNSPETRWAGIMRAIQTNDFQAANVEYIQFWMMDPFNTDNTDPSSSGNLYFNIGNISEDILRDNYKSAENGLPTPVNATTTVSTDWGLVPEVQPLLNTFNNDPAERPYQDVGLDGLGTLTSPTEQSFFSNYLSQVQGIVSPSAYAAISADPSADDFHYFRGDDYDNANVKTLERYKLFNGMENNSRTTEQSPQSYPTSATLTPNVEDINRDNNLSTAEGYYQYHISLKPGDFASGVGTNYITNVFSTQGQNIKNGTSKPIKWYQFKIPIKTPEQKIGAIENFQSIRFIRMFVKGVDKPIVLRFARLELVRTEWRKYGFDLLQPGIYIPNDEAGTLFNVAAVSIEENGSNEPVNYVLPPNINRQINVASANLLALNEQALALTVCDLQDGDSRAAFKNTDLDVRSYKKLQMFLHAEASANTANPLNHNDLRAFIRLGTDYTDNYYEYEIPLQVTAPGYYNGSNQDDQYRVWPEANDMVLEFAKLQAAKLQRNTLGVGVTTEYTVMDGTRKISVKGNPNLSAIKTIMIGVRNPKKLGMGDTDDGLSKCGQVWVNELRLTDFDEEGGGAANARVTAKLADFGTLSLSGNYYAPGFGSIENKVSQRKRATLKQYDITSSFELGKFLPADANIQIPMFLGYSETFITPQFNPLDPDILLAPLLKDPNMSKAARDSLKWATQDYTLRRSLNFTNVKKGKGKNSKKSHIYDISNFAVSYSFSEIFRRNVNVEYDSTRNYKAGLMYNYAPNPKNIKPFAKSKLLQSKYLLLVKDVNFYLFPNKLGFSTDVERGYNTIKTRDITEGEMLVIPTFNKRFTMNRNYDLKYDITKGLKLDFVATNEARILEPYGALDTKEKKDTVLNNFLDLGKTTQYNHQVNVNYAIPINKLPLMDFTTASVRYTGTYNWVRAPFNADSLGNTIQNSRAIQWTGQLNMVTLYNKVPYLKKINQKGNKGNKNNKPTTPPKGKTGTTAKDSTKKNDNPPIVLEYIARVLMSLKNVNVTYAINNGTILPGYKQFTNMMGMDANFAGPTPGFILGDQKDIRQTAIENDWLVKTKSLNVPFVQTSSTNLNIRANVEPIPDMKIEVTGVRTTTTNKNEFFRWKENDTLPDGTITNHFKSESPMETGNFSMSFLAYSTSFKDGDATFTKFLNSRADISSRLGAENDSSLSSINGFAEGYNPTSQDVLIPAFLSAYGGTSPLTVGLTAFPKLPKPNWRATYDGLSKIEAIKKYFKSVTLSHAYRSTYNVGGYTSNLLFKDTDGDGFTGVREAVSSYANNPNFLAKDLITTVTVSEQWSPLIKLDITLHNSILVNCEYKKDRNLSLGLTSKTITEVAGSEIVVGTGYRIKDVSLGKKLMIKGKPIKSDLNLKCDLSFRKNITVIRRIVEEVSQATGGTNIISIKLSADYVINERINVRFFYDRIINKPVVSNSFPTTNTNAGISLRLTLSN